MKGNATSSKASDLYERLFEMGRLLKSRMAAGGYGPSFYLHLETLRFLEDAPNSDMRELARYLRVSAPSATGLVDALVAQKLVTRKQGANDRRKVLISVSAKGRATLAKAKRHREAALTRLIAPLSQKDRAEFTRILSVITRND